MGRRNNFYFSLYWYLRPMTGKEYIEQIREYLSQLQAGFSEFQELHIVVDDGTRPITLDWAGFSAEVISELPSDWAYNNKDDPKNRKFTLTSTPAVAFSSSFTNGVNPGPRDVCSISFTMGCVDNDVNTLLIDFVPALENPVFLEKVFCHAIGYWTPNHAVLARPSYDDALDQPIGDIRPGWLTYMKGTDALPYIPERCTAEPLHEGILIRTLKRLPDTADAEIIPILKQLRDALEPHGILKNPKKRMKNKQ